MTWLNALFNAAGVALLVLAEWGRHRFEQWPTERKRTTVIMVIAFIIFAVAAVTVVWLTFGGPSKGNDE